MDTPAPRFKHKLGVTLKDVVTGFEGVVTGRTQHLYMCNRYDLTPAGLTSDGKLKEVYSFDEDALDVVSATPIREVPDPDFKYGLGIKAKDTVSLLDGVIIARTQYLYLCSRYYLQPQGAGDKGERKAGLSVDEAAIELTQTEKPIPAMKKDNGGPPTRVLRI